MRDIFLITEEQIPINQIVLTCCFKCKMIYQKRFLRNCFSWLIFSVTERCRTVQSVDLLWNWSIQPLFVGRGIEDVTPSQINAMMDSRGPLYYQRGTWKWGWCHFRYFQPAHQSFIISFEIFPIMSSSTYSHRSRGREGKELQRLFFALIEPCQRRNPSLPQKDSETNSI